MYSEPEYDDNLSHNDKIVYYRFHEEKCRRNQHTGSEWFLSLTLEFQNMADIMERTGRDDKDILPCEFMVTY